MGITGISSAVDVLVQAAGAQASAASGQQEFSDQEKQEVADLKKRDAEVKAHEAAHVAAGGQYVRGGPSYEYETGPDGKKYAVGGEVSIDTAPVAGDPQATVAKMQVVKRAALAPAQPSGQDRAVAAQATQEQAKAQKELSEKSQGPGTPQAGEAPKSLKGGPESSVKGTVKDPSPFQKSAADLYAKNSFFPSNSGAETVSTAMQTINTLG